MYKNIQIRNALECVPRSQYFSVKMKKDRIKKKRQLLKKMFKSTLIFVSDKDIATIT